MALTYSQLHQAGWEMPEFALPDTEGNTVSPADFSDKKGLLVVFTCNHCPYAKAAWPLIINLHKKYGGEVGFLAINPNDAATYPEDSFEEMKKKEREWGIPFPYLRDESQEVAKAFQAECTPDPYLFKKTDDQWTVFYHGRVNDNWQSPTRVTERNLEDALERLVTGGTPPSPQEPSIGCSIKWKEG